MPTETRTESRSNRRGERASVTDETGRGPDTHPAEPRLHAAIERTLLQAKIAALERELRTRRERHVVVLEQYERLLSERSCTCDSGPDST